MGVVHPLISKKIDKKATIVYAEIDVEKLALTEGKDISYDEPSRFPEMTVDLSFAAESFGEIAEEVKRVNSELVKKLGVTDVYSDEKGKSITVRLLFSHKDRTLTREEVTKVIDEIIAGLAKKGIELRQ